MSRPLTSSNVGGAGPSKQYRAGIVGIERQLEKQARDTEKNISEAFQDLNSLIDMAKPMVKLVTTISNKLKVELIDVQGVNTELIIVINLLIFKIG